MPVALPRSVLVIHVVDVVDCLVQQLHRNCGFAGSPKPKRLWRAKSLGIEKDDEDTGRLLARVRCPRSGK